MTEVATQGTSVLSAVSNASVGLYSSLQAATADDVVAAVEEIIGRKRAGTGPAPQPLPTSRNGDVPA